MGVSVPVFLVGGVGLVFVVGVCCEGVDDGVEGLEGLGEGDGVDGFVAVCGVVWGVCGGGWVCVVDDGGGEVLCVDGEEDCFLLGEVLVFVLAEVDFVGAVPVGVVVVDGF